MSDNTSELQGKVKWFSNDKGYGFITDENNQDFYFSIRDVIGQSIPLVGSKVSFLSHQNEKGRRAKSVNIKELINDQTPYVICTRCNKKMVPRIVFDKGSPSHSICPFCAKMYKDFGSNFKGWLVLGLIFLAINGSRPGQLYYFSHKTSN